MRFAVAFILIVATSVCFVAWAYQDRLIFFPEKLPLNYKYEFDGKFEEDFIQVGDSRINTLLFSVQNPQGIVFYFHGNAGSLRSWGRIARDFLPYNVDVLIMDYPGFGKSSGEISEEKMYLMADAIFTRYSKKYTKSYLFGRSIGSGVATWLAAKRSPDMLLLESPLYNLADLAAFHYPWFPSNLLRFHFRNDIRMKDVKCPVYVIHGTADEVIPFSESVHLTESSLTNMKLTVVNGGHHNDLSLFPEHAAWMKEIFSRN